MKLFKIEYLEEKYPSGKNKVLINDKPLFSLPACEENEHTVYWGFLNYLYKRGRQVVVIRELKHSDTMLKSVAGDTSKYGDMVNYFNRKRKELIGISAELKQDRELLNVLAKKYKVI